MENIKHQAASTIDHVKHTIDAGAVGIGVGAFIELLPAISAFLTIIWILIRIYETRTVQRLLGNPVVADDQDD